jgi:hypothetical protein
MTAAKLTVTNMHRQYMCYDLILMANREFWSRILMNCILKFEGMSFLFTIYVYRMLIL